MTILHIGHCYFSVQMTTLSLKNKAISYGFRNHKGHFYDTFMMVFFLCVILMIFPNSIILKIVLWKKVILVQNNILIF